MGFKLAVEPPAGSVFASVGAFAAGAADWTWHDTPVPDRDSHFIAQANAFLDQIEGQPAKLCSLEDAAQTLRFNLAALSSAETGTRVEVR